MHVHGARGLGQPCLGLPSIAKWVPADQDQRSDEGDWDSKRLRMQPIGTSRGKSYALLAP